MSLMEWMEDFDNGELPYEDWQAQLEDAVREYNEQFHTEYNPNQSFKQYVLWKFKYQ